MFFAEGYVPDWLRAKVNVTKKEFHIEPIKSYYIRDYYQYQLHEHCFDRISLKGFLIL